MELFRAVEKNDIQTLKSILTNKASNVNATYDDGQSVLHIAATGNFYECMDLLLRQYNIKVDAQDNNGNTPLHISTSKGHVHCAKLLISSNASTTIKNNSGLSPPELASTSEAQALFKEHNSYTSTSALKEQKLLIISELPSDLETLKKLTADMVVSNHLFQERVKETIHQLIEEKHIALHKNHLLQYAAGLGDQQEGTKFIDQLQYLQDENEQQVATIAYLKNKMRLMEKGITQQEEYYRKHIAEMSFQHASQVDMILKRNEETEKTFLNYQKQWANGAEELNKLRVKVQVLSKAGEVLKGGDPITFKELHESAERVLRAESMMKKAEAEKLAMQERWKMGEKLKAIVDKENQDMKRELAELRKQLKDGVLLGEKSNGGSHDDLKGQITFTNSEKGKEIKAASATKLLERLTDGKNYVLKGITTRFKKNQSLPVDEQRPIQLRLCQVLKFWIDFHWNDFAADKIMLQELTAFIESIEEESFRNLLKTSVNIKLNGSESTSSTIENEEMRPRPILPKALSKKYDSGGDRSSNWGFMAKRGTAIEEAITVKFIDLDPLEIARQLTLLEFELFKAIRPEEFLNQAWMKPDKEEKAPNLMRITRWTNHIIHWVVTEIVQMKDGSKARAAVFEKFVAVAMQLDKLNNFNGLKEILAGLQSSAVYRLKKTKQNVAVKFLKSLDDLTRQTSSELNFKNLRAKVHSADPPLIPFPGVYQSDLVFLDTCSKDKLDGGLINFHKHQKIANYIMELQSFQQTAYNLEPISEITDYLKSYKELDDEAAYNLSLVCEPRI